jgi:Transposase Tn5 dimerisation domain/Transposase DNA-binding
MSSWVETEMVACQCHDARHAQRLARLLARLSEKPVHSIPSACHGWAETMAAYRFLDNPAISEQEILSGHKYATLARIQEQAVVLLVQDTTFLDYGTTQPKQGMGTVKIKVREEYLLHPTVVFTPERMNLGVLGLQVWQRPEQPVAQERHRKPLEEKESYRWLKGYQLACEVQQRCPDTLVVNVADREGDIHEWFLDAMRRLSGERAEFIIRAKCNRRLAKGQEPRYLWEEMQQARPAGSITVELTRQPDRPPRQVTLQVAVKQVTFHGARRPGGRLPPVELVAVYAKEPRPPSGEEPIEWLLLTSLPVADFPSACTVVQWYRCRWEIELFFRVLKQGCQIEQLRLQTDQRLLNALALYLIVAWRIHSITMAGRTYPDVSCEVVFEPREWHTIYTMQHHRHPPQAPPSLRDMVRGLAQLGGFLARKGDGEPGIQAIWQGYQCLHEFIYALETHRTVNTLERNV